MTIEEKRLCDAFIAQLNSEAKQADQALYAAVEKCAAELYTAFSAHDAAINDLCNLADDLGRLYPATPEVKAFNGSNIYTWPLINSFFQAVAKFQADAAAL